MSALRYDRSCIYSLSCLQARCVCRRSLMNSSDRGHAVEVVTARPPRGVSIVDRPGEWVRAVGRPSRQGRLRARIPPVPQLRHPLFFRSPPQHVQTPTIVESLPTTGMVMRVAVFADTSLISITSPISGPMSAIMMVAAGWVDRCGTHGREARDRIGCLRISSSPKASTNRRSSHLESSTRRCRSWHRHGSVLPDWAQALTAHPLTSSMLAP